MDYFQRDFIKINAVENYVCRLNELALKKQVTKRFEDFSSRNKFFRPWDHSGSIYSSSIVAKVKAYHNPDTYQYPDTVVEGSHFMRTIQKRSDFSKNCYQRVRKMQSGSSKNNTFTDTSSLILNRPLILDVHSIETAIPELPKKSILNQKPKHLVHPRLSSDSDHALIICDEDDMQPLDLSVKRPDFNTPAFHIEVIGNLSPTNTCGNNAQEDETSNETSPKRSRNKKQKQKRRICIACNRMYLKTKNLRWHFKSKLHHRRVSKLGMEDPANLPDTWYSTSRYSLIEKKEEIHDANNGK